VLQATNLVFDTEDVVITGKGSVNLGTEAYDLTIQGKPKKFRLLRLKSPIAIRGPLRKPDIGLESGNSITQTGIAAALSAVVAPLAAVLAFVDPGLAKDADCSALLAEAKSSGAPVKTADVKRADRG
jgi:AsmA family protein